MQAEQSFLSNQFDVKQPHANTNPNASERAAIQPKPASDWSCVLTGWLTHTPISKITTAQMAIWITLPASVTAVLQWVRMLVVPSTAVLYRLSR